MKLSHKAPASKARAWGSVASMEMFSGVRNKWMCFLSWVPSLKFMRGSHLIEGGDGNFCNKKANGPVW